jgi:beta-lactamase class A
LQAELEARVESFPGVAGVMVRDLASGASVRVNADEPFPTASTIKIHVLAQLLRRAEAGEIDLGRTFAVDKSVYVPGSGVLTYFDDPASLTIRDVANLMILISDNTATNLCIDWATFDGTNAMLRSLDLQKTVLRRKMQDHESVRRGDENISTPDEVVRFLEILYRAEGVSPWVGDETLRILKKYKRGYLSQGLPEDVPIANKTGGMPRVRNDAGIVYLKRRPYVIGVMTKYLLCDGPAAEAFIADVARRTHATMSAFDVTSKWGQGLPPDLLT